MCAGCVSKLPLRDSPAPQGTSAITSLVCYNALTASVPSRRCLREFAGITCRAWYGRCHTLGAAHAQVAGGVHAVDGLAGVFSAHCDHGRSCLGRFRLSGAARVRAASCRRLLSGSPRQSHGPCSPARPDSIACALRASRLVWCRHASNEWVLTMAVSVARALAQLGDTV